MDYIHVGFFAYLSLFSWVAKNKESLSVKLVKFFLLGLAVSLFSCWSYYSVAADFVLVTWHAAYVSASLSFVAYVVLSSYSYEIILVSALFVFSVLAVFIIIRGGAPRYRIDQLAKYNFDTLLPVTAVYVAIVLIAVLLL